jgi:hypothetical protein
MNRLKNYMQTDTERRTVHEDRYSRQTDRHQYTRTDIQDRQTDTSTRGQIFKADRQTPVHEDRYSRQTDRHKYTRTDIQGRHTDTSTRGQIFKADTQTPVRGQTHKDTRSVLSQTDRHRQKQAITCSKTLMALLGLFAPIFPAILLLAPTLPNLKISRENSLPGL